MKNKQAEQIKKLKGGIQLLRGILFASRAVHFSAKKYHENLPYDANIYVRKSLFYFIDGWADEMHSFEQRIAELENAINQKGKKRSGK